MTLRDIRLTDGTEQRMAHTPPASAVLAYVAMVPLVAGSGVAAACPGPVGERAARLAVGWGGAVLCFLAGVRRGLSFRQPGGSTLGEHATMFGTFVLGVGSLLSPEVAPAALLQLAGFAAIRQLDPAAARRGEAPRYFARLRPVQMLVPMASLLLLLAAEARRSRR